MYGDKLGPVNLNSQTEEIAGVMVDGPTSREATPRSRHA